ncbi:hypothetical protein, partial [Microvirga tunisiensis]|uniref:hypothetical protein n=1 Tax=Microvirga tunisiensis TaxID=2108360 RepID=UPI001AEE500C
DQLIACCHAHLPHHRPRSSPELGSKSDEATIQNQGAIQAMQCARDDNETRNRRPFTIDNPVNMERLS